MHEDSQSNYLDLCSQKNEISHLVCLGKHGLYPCTIYFESILLRKIKIRRHHAGSGSK